MNNKLPIFGAAEPAETQWEQEDSALQCSCVSYTDAGDCDKSCAKEHGCTCTIACAGAGEGTDH